MCRNLYCSTIPYVEKFVLLHNTLDIEKWGKVYNISKGEFVYAYNEYCLFFPNWDLQNLSRYFHTFTFCQNFKLALFFLDKRIVVFNIYYHFTILLKLCIAWWGFKKGILEQPPDSPFSKIVRKIGTCKQSRFLL